MDWKKCVCAHHLSCGRTKYTADVVEMTMPTTRLKKLRNTVNLLLFSESSDFYLLSHCNKNLMCLMAFTCYQNFFLILQPEHVHKRCIYFTSRKQQCVTISFNCTCRYGMRAFISYLTLYSHTFAFLWYFWYWHTYFYRMFFYITDIGLYTNTDLISMIYRLWSFSLENSYIYI